jgi:hypothetical protein
LGKVSEHSDLDELEFAARIIGALGQLMVDFHHRDLAVQNAISEMTSAPTSSGLHLTDLQHIDLVTQTHADLARFLPKLALGIRVNDIEEHSLASTMTLRSLQDALLRAPLNGTTDHVVDDDIGAGDMDLF